MEYGRGGWSEGVERGEELLVILYLYTLAPSRVEDLKVVSTMSSTSEVSLTWKPSLMSLTRKCPLSFIVEHSVRGRSAFEYVRK